MKLAFTLGTILTGLLLAVTAPASPSATPSAPASVASVQPASSVTDTSDETMACPPTVYECCDSTAGSGTNACVGHGGKCGILYICGKPY
jgi:hypothetical protein